MKTQIKKGQLCKFWDDREEKFVVDTFEYYDKDSEYPYEGFRDKYENCQPIRIENDPFHEIKDKLGVEIEPTLESFVSNFCDGMEGDFYLLKNGTLISQSEVDTILIYLNGGMLNRIIEILK